MLSALTRQGHSAPPTAVPATPLPLEHIVREGRLVIGPALAGRLLAEANYAGQRPVRRFHVEDLAGHMRRGHWTGGTQLFFGRLGGLHLVNGQHRLQAVVESGCDIEFQVAIADVASEAELASLYYRHDRLARGRTISEVLSAVGIGERHGLSAGMTKAVFQAMPLLVRRFDRPNYQTDSFIRDDDARLSAAAQWWPTAALYERLISPAHKLLKRRLMNSQVTAVALVTLKHKEERAIEFWGGIAENDGLRKGDPRHSFINDDHSTHGSSTVLAAVAATAWNAFFEDRQIKSIRIYEDTPIRISGTAFSARKR